MILDSIRSKFQLKLKDREAAGNILGEAIKDVIKKEKGRKNSLVLGIPRGGVVVADIIARKLSCEFGIIISRKLRAPHNREIAIGAVVEDGTTYLNELIIKELEISREYIEKEKIQQLEEIRRQVSLYCSGNRIFSYCNNISFHSKAIILADDGAATGSTFIAAARWIRTKNPSRLLLTVPVIPKDTVNLLKIKLVDHIEAITSPPKSKFSTVQQYYHNFEQVTDEQVIAIIDKNRK